MFYTISVLRITPKSVTIGVNRKKDIYVAIKNIGSAPEKPTKPWRSSTFQCNWIKNYHSPWKRCLHYSKLWISQQNIMLITTPVIHDFMSSSQCPISQKSSPFLIRLYQSSYFIPLSSHESVILSSIFHYHYHDQQKQPVILSLIQSIDMTMEYSWSLLAINIPL